MSARPGRSTASSALFPRASDRIHRERLPACSVGLLRGVVKRDGSGGNDDRFAGVPDGCRRSRRAPSDPAVRGAIDFSVVFLDENVVSSRATLDPARETAAGFSGGMEISAKHLWSPRRAVPREMTARCGDHVHGTDAQTAATRPPSGADRLADRPGVVGPRLRASVLDVTGQRPRDHGGRRQGGCSVGVLCRHAPLSSCASVVMRLCRHAATGQTPGVFNVLLGSGTPATPRAAPASARQPDDSVVAALGNA